MLFVVGFPVVPLVNQLAVSNTLLDSNQRTKTHMNIVQQINYVHAYACLIDS